MKYLNEIMMNFPFGFYVFDLNLRILEYNGAGKVLLEKLSGESIREQASFIEMINNKVPKETMKSINNFISSGNDFFEIHFKKIDFKEENNIFFLVLQKDSSLCNYEEFAECTWLPYTRGRTGGSISRFLGKLNRDKAIRFFKVLQEEWGRLGTEQLKGHRFWALDSTSITSYSENIASVAYGKNKDLISAPQTNVLFLVDQKTGIPLYFRNFCGVRKKKGTVKEILDISITEAGPDLLLIRLTADDFLYRMPALIIGTLLEIGHDRRRPDCIKAIFEGTEKAGAPCETKGLLLESVHY